MVQPSPSASNHKLMCSSANGNGKSSATGVTPDAACADESSNPHAGLAEEQQRQMLWKALESLPEKERMAVVLRDIEGMSTSEVAEMLGSSETTVRSQISRARVRMKDAIDQMIGGRL